MKRCDEETGRAILAVLHNREEKGHEAILTTASADGMPHATWMASWCSPDARELVTITSPDSLKVRNIRENPAVEWLFSTPDKHELVYLRGQAEVVMEVSEVKRWWNEILDKSRAFFLEQYNSGIGVAVIKTKVQTAVYCRPYECSSVEVDIDDLE